MLVYTQINRRKELDIALILMASGMLFNVLAEIVWTILDVVLHQQPFPSLADGFYLMYYPLFTMGIMFLPSDRLSQSGKGEKNNNRYSYNIGCSRSDILGVHTKPILESGGESALALALSVAYPILDIVLIFALLELLYGGGIHCTWVRYCLC